MLRRNISHQLYQPVIIPKVKMCLLRNKSIRLNRSVFLRVKTYLLRNNFRSLNRLVILRRVKTYLLHNKLFRHYFLVTYSRSKHTCSAW